LPSPRITALGLGGGLPVEHITFGEDEVKRKDLGVREWMLPPKQSPAAAARPLPPKVKCRLAHKQAKHVLTMAREATVRDLLAKAHDLFGGLADVEDERGDGMGMASRSVELRDAEGYAFVHDDLIGDLADIDTNTLLVNVV
jgi:hypothetical protein